MFPIRDNVPSTISPLVNYLLIVVCVLVFLAQSMESPDGPSLVERYGFIPVRLTAPDKPVEITVSARRVETERGPMIEYQKKTAAPSAVPPWMTLLTCCFLHGGFMHLFGNMWFLYIFGDNIEDRFGHLGYLLFYLICGVAASLIHYFTDTTSSIPTIGASGAIAGIMGAYFVWYPGARVQALIPLGIIMQIVAVPAFLFLGLWFAIQLFSGFGSGAGGESGGVAFWAHIGGFAVGAILAFLLDRLRVLRPLEPIRNSKF
ncbi:rhomboid family intramembrane serine protease [Planctomicrobium sp. SH668]|uniref:rhomboid family intramembrane serine protease n=1 Tax=Planctomicrobium sp. SH668 TaxID=3448126 RepID=UPI003F5C9DFD